MSATRVGVLPRASEIDAEDAEISTQRHRLFELTARFRVGNLVTHAADGMLRSRPMTVALLDSSSEELGFLTLVDADSVADVRHDPMVGVVFQAGRHHVSWSGRAYVDGERYRVIRAWQPEMARWFPEGPEDPHLVLLVVRAIRGEYWSVSVVSRALSAIGAAGTADAEDDPMRHGLVVFGDEGAITDW